MAVKVAIIYYSATGTTYHLVRAVEQGASEGDAEVRLRKVRELAPDEAIASNQGWAAHRLESQHVKEATNDDLVWADAIIFGTPTRYGLPTAQLKQFLDTTGKLWAEGALLNKVCSSFTSSATQHGGQETTIISLNMTFYHWGAIIVGPGYADPHSVQSRKSLWRIVHKQQWDAQARRDRTCRGPFSRQAGRGAGRPVCRRMEETLNRRSTASGMQRDTPKGA
jgi:NAD(P)H dehydrogenase (quinone)